MTADVARKRVSITRTFFMWAFLLLSFFCVIGLMSVLTQRVFTAELPEAAHYVPERINSAVHRELVVGNSFGSPSGPRVTLHDFGAFMRHVQPGYTVVIVAYGGSEPRVEYWTTDREVHYMTALPLGYQTSVSFLGPFGLQSYWWPVIDQESNTFRYEAYWPGDMWLLFMMYVVGVLAFFIFGIALSPPSKNNTI